MFKSIPLSIKLFILLFVINAIFVVASYSKPNLETFNRGEKIFKANCSGCHLNGQNLIKADKPIIGSLKLKSKGVLKKFLESPPQPMPKYDNITSMDAQFDSLYEYLIMLMGK